MGGGIIVEKTPELLERLKNLKNVVEKAPPDYDRMVEYFPNAFGSLDRIRAKEKQEAAEKAKT